MTLSVTYRPVPLLAVNQQGNRAGLAAQLSSGKNAVHSPGFGRCSHTGLLPSALTGGVAYKAIADATDDRARAAASYRMSSVTEVRRFIRQVLGQLRAEMRNRSMWLPGLPPDIEMEEGDA